MPDQNEPSTASSMPAEFPAAPIVLSPPQTAAKTGHKATPAPLRLLCVTAHPDDECFAFGGALALAADHGAETSVVCFTDGQAASNRGESGSAAELGRMRRAEFAASCSILGVTHREMLDYQDGQLEFASFSEAAAKLVQRIRSFRPHVVLTFGGDGGMNTHPDHTLVSAFTTAAFHWAGQAKRLPALGPAYQPKRLYTVTNSFFLPDRQPPLPSPWTVTLDIRSVQARKQEAFRAHTSQAPLMERTKDLFARYGAYEYYTLAASPEPHAARQTSGLSAGL